MAEIVIDDLTTRTLEGTGVFDSLMTANRIRLDREFDKTRIKGPDYSKVYLGGMEAAMQQSIIYLLGRQKADKEAELIDEQILKTIAEVILIDKQGQKLDAETDLLIDQLISEALNRDKTTAEINLLVDQLLTESKKRDQMDSEIALTDQKTLTEVENTKLVTQNTALALANTELTDKKTLTEIQNELLVKQQIQKMTQDVLIAKEDLKIRQEQLKIEQEKLILVTIQTWNETAKISDTPSTNLADPDNLVVPTSIGGISGQQLELVESQTWAERAKVFDDISNLTGDPATPTVVGGVLGAQMTKIKAENSLLTQKEATELAQTDTEGLDADSILGKQAALYQKQADGFDRDAEQKLAKIFSDTLNTQIVSREDTETDVAGMAYEDICEVLNKARAGISAGSSSKCATPGQTVVINAHT